MNYLGDFLEDAAVPLTFTTNDAAGGAVAPSSAFENTDLKIYKDGSDTEKATVNGITMTSPFDSITGLHHVGIDTSINTGDTGFWTVGADYKVVLAPDETVDGQTVVAVIGEFSIENRNMVDVSALALEVTSQDILDQVTGTGNRTITINVKDDGANNLQDVLVRIDDASKTTDISGNAVFALDDGDYDVILRKQFVTFTVPEPLTVAGDGPHPYVGVLVVPSAPTNPDTCVVYGSVIDVKGDPVEGASIFINETDNDTFASTTQKIVKNKQATSDVDGFWELEIVRSSQLDPVDSPYEAIITYPNGFKFETTITVPDQASVEFSTIVGT